MDLSLINPAGTASINAVADKIISRAPSYPPNSKSADPASGRPRQPAAKNWSKP